MEQVRKRAFDCRISLYQLADKANVSGTVMTRWVRGTGTPSLATIDKFEKKLCEIEAERSRPAVSA
jgi:predicted transcriptional regulator